MAKQQLDLLDNVDNVLNFPSSTLSTYMVLQEDVAHIVDSMKLYLGRNRSHFAHSAITKQVNGGLKNFIFVSMTKYPLPAAFNIPSKKVVINLSTFGRKSVYNIESRDLFALILYGYVCAIYTVLKMDADLYNIISNFISSVFLKMYAKKYGLVGSYQGNIPKLRFIVSVFVLESFFGMSPSSAIKKASDISGTHLSDLDVDLKDYNMLDAKDFIKVLSDSGVLHGINLYDFVSMMVRRFGVNMLPMFEDSMRFMASIAGSSVGSNSLFEPTIQLYNVELYNRIIINIEKKVK